MTNYSGDPGYSDTDDNKTSAFEVLHSDESVEKINRIEALMKLGDENSIEDACKIAAELFIEWTVETFEVSGLGYTRNNSKTGTPRPNDVDLEFITNQQALFRMVDIIDGKVHLVFWPEDDIVEDPVTGDEVPLKELVFPWQNVFSLDQVDDVIDLDNSRDFTDQRYLAALATEAAIIMNDFIEDPNNAQEDKAGIIALAADLIRAQTEIKKYMIIHENRIMCLDPSEWWYIPDGMPFDIDFCKLGENSHPALSPVGLFIRMAMLEEYDPNHQPDETSLCYELKSLNDKGETTVHLVPVANLLRPPACDWQDDGDADTSSDDF